MLLAVFLGKDRVGDLTVSRDSVEFRLVEPYRSSYPRQVLGQVFEDEPDAVHRSRMRLPPFFSNLLPEGALRGLLAGQIGVAAEREPLLVAHVGEDLPGATRVLVEDASLDDREDVDDAPPSEPPDVLEFSLAGVQLKFSALHDAGRGATIPAHGRGGDWIIKLPDPRYPGVPENEWSMMTLARRTGLDVADVELIDVGDIRGLPPLPGPWGNAKALAVRRFDRKADGERVHMEDFAQILNERPSHHRKYRAANFETLARILGRVAPASPEEFLRRLLFNVGIGNGDAHIKNWSVIYRDGLHANLSPAYDIVSTIQDLPDDDLGLNLAKSKRFEDVRLESFTRLAQKAELDIDSRAVVGDMVARIRMAWSELRGELPLSDDAKATIEAHWKRIPVLRA